MPPPRPTAVHPQQRPGGPLDVDDLDPGVALPPNTLDFGAIRVPVPDRGKVTVEPTANGRMQAVHISLPEGRLSVSALAAPKSSKLWPELAKEIDVSLRDGGAKVRSFRGAWGRELHATTGAATSVFVGVDGARWMLYGVATGPTQHAAVLDREMRQMLNGTVVVRGRSPYPVRTVLPIKVPEELAPDDAEATVAAPAAKGSARTGGATTGAVASVNGALKGRSTAPSRPGPPPRAVPPAPAPKPAEPLREAPGNAVPTGAVPMNGGAPARPRPPRPGEGPRRPDQGERNGANGARPPRRPEQQPAPAEPGWADPVRRVADGAAEMDLGRGIDDVRTEMWPAAPPPPDARRGGPVRGGDTVDAPLADRRPAPQRRPTGETVDTPLTERWPAVSPLPRPAPPDDSPPDDSPLTQRWPAQPPVDRRPADRGAPPDQPPTERWPAVSPPRADRQADEPPPLRRDEPAAAERREPDPPMTERWPAVSPPRGESARPDESPPRRRLADSWAEDEPDESWDRPRSGEPSGRRGIAAGVSDLPAPPRDAAEELPPTQRWSAVSDPPDDPPLSRRRADDLPVGRDVAAELPSTQRWSAVSEPRDERLSRDRADDLPVERRVSRDVAEDLPSTQRWSAVSELRDEPPDEAPSWRREDDPPAAERRVFDGPAIADLPPSREIAALDDSPSAGRWGDGRDVEVDPPPLVDQPPAADSLPRRRPDDPERSRPFDPLSPEWRPDPADLEPAALEADLPMTERWPAVSRRVGPPIDMFDDGSSGPRDRAGATLDSPLTSRRAAGPDPIAEPPAPSGGRRRRVDPAPDQAERPEPRAGRRRALDRQPDADAPALAAPPIAVPDVAAPADPPRAGRRRAPEVPVEPPTEPLPVVPPVESPSGRHAVPPAERPRRRRAASEEPAPTTFRTNGSRPEADHGDLGRYHSVWDYNASPEYRAVEEYYVTPEQFSAPQRAAETGPIPVYEESPSGRHRRPV